MGKLSVSLILISLMAFCSQQLTANEDASEPTKSSAVPAYTLNLISLPGYFEVEVFGINGQGQISGGLAFGDPGHENHEHSAFIYDTNSGEMTLVPEAGVLMGVNDFGTSAGSLLKVNEDTPSVCIIRDALGAITTFTLPSIPGPYSSCQARGINNAGMVTGYAVGDAGMIGFLYDPESGTAEEFLPSGVKGQTIAQGINSAGQVVGNIWPDAADALFPGSVSSSYGFLRDPDGSLRFFTVNGNPTSKARGISDSGLITGFLRDEEEMMGFVIRLDGKSVFQDIEAPADQLLFSKPCSSASTSPGSEWKRYGSVVAASISNTDVITGNCSDVWVLFDADGKEADYTEFKYGFLATPNS